MRKSLLVKKTVQLQERDRFQKFKKCTIDYVKQELLKLNRNWTAIDELVAKISELINSFINMNQDAYSSLNETERDELKKTKYVLDELLDSRLNIAYLREKTSYAVRRAPGNLLNDEYLKELRERVRRENYCCMYDEVPLIGCPQNVSLEHFYPASKGGRTDKSSCYLVSAAANLHKYDLTPMDYMYIFHPEVGASWYIKRFNEIADSLIESKEKECATLEILYTLAHFIIKDERLTWKKSLGCLIGFAGVITSIAGPFGTITCTASDA